MQLYTYVTFVARRVAMLRDRFGTSRMLLHERT